MYKILNMLLLAEIVFTLIAFFLGVMIIHLIAKTILKLDGFIQRNKITYWSCLVIGVLVAGSIYISVS
jgi:lipopolysaccharide export LptBFGC system permease protein LptF